MRSSGPCNDVRVAGAGRKTSIVVYAYDAVRLVRDEIRMIRYRALDPDPCFRMVFPENRYTLFRIMR